MRALLPYFALAVAVLFVGCAALDQSDAPNQEQLLLSAGFQARTVKTPQQAQVLQNLTPYKINKRVKGKETYFVFADPKRNVVFIGGPAQFQKFRDLLAQQNLNEEAYVGAAETQMLQLETTGMWEPFW